MEKEHFDSLLRPLFRNDANFCHVEKHTNALIYRVDWKLPAEGRPNKRSRPIEIHISEDTLADYKDAPYQADRDQMDCQIRKHVMRELASFVPEHTSSTFEHPLAEIWIITSAIACPP
jgi:hypothetical protein